MCAFDRLAVVDANGLAVSTTEVSPLRPLAYFCVYSIILE